MFWENLITLCNKNDISPSALLLELKISHGSVTKWKHGAIPRDATLKKIADYFGVSPQELLGEPVKKSVDEEFAELFGSLSEEQKKIVIASIKGILSNQ